MKKTISVNPVIDTGPGPGKYPINMKFMRAPRASSIYGLTVYSLYYYDNKNKLSADLPRDATPRIHGSGLAALRHYAPGGTLRLTKNTPGVKERPYRVCVPLLTLGRHMYI